MTSVQAQSITIKISDLKGISNCELQLSTNPGLYLVAGENGVGKSTIFAALSRLVYKNALMKYLNKNVKVGAKIQITHNSRVNCWQKVFNWQRKDSGDEEIFFDGYFEAGLLFGTRFNDIHKSILGKLNKVTIENLKDADEFIYRNLGYIAKGNTEHYSDLKTLKTKTLSFNLGFSSPPYFLIKNGEIVSQFHMSSGELLILTLLHFINEKILFTDKNKTKIIILDEIDISLHPSAQDRLAIFLHKLAENYNVCIYFSAHSTQMSRNINPENIILLCCNGNVIENENPCFPNYITRDLFTNEGVDFAFLVEDDLTKTIIEYLLRKNNLKKNKLYKILKTGGWRNTRDLHLELNRSGVLGKTCRTISILDGDIKTEFDKERNDEINTLCVNFLPIGSIEKYLHNELIEKRDHGVARHIESQLFQGKSLSSITRSFLQKNPKPDSKGKKLFSYLTDQAISEGADKSTFKKTICEEVVKYNSLLFENLETFIKDQLSPNTYYSRIKDNQLL